MTKKIFAAVGARGQLQYRYKMALSKKPRPSGTPLEEGKV